MTARFEAKREQLNMQAHFVKPVFDLFKDLPGLLEHLLGALAPYGLRLADMKFDASNESLGETHLHFGWPDLDTTVRVHLDRVVVDSGFPRFLYFKEDHLLSRVFGVLGGYLSSPEYRAYGVTRSIHGHLDIPAKEFLARFSTEAPEGLGPMIASGTVFYFGADAERLATSVTFDFSRPVEGGLFTQLSVLYDAAQLKQEDLITLFEEQLSRLLSGVGLELVGD